MEVVRRSDERAYFINAEKLGNPLHKACGPVVNTGRLTFFFFPSRTDWLR